MQAHAVQGAPLGPSDRSFIVAVARRIVRDDAEAEDVAQEALLLAHRYRDSFRGEAGYRTWLFRIATTAALTALRRRRGARRRLDALTVHVAAGGAPDPRAAAPDVLLERAHAHARLLREIARLDDTYRHVVALRVVDDASEREIATALGLSLATVKIRGFRARRLLRERLAVD